MSNVNSVSQMTNFVLVVDVILTRSKDLDKLKWCWRTQKSSKNKGNDKSVVTSCVFALHIQETRRNIEEIENELNGK